VTGTFRLSYQSQRNEHPAGRLVMMVWQGHERNQWDVAIHRSLEGFAGPVAVAPEGPSPFSLRVQGPPIHL
jgi:hypothetical protein